MTLGVHKNIKEVGIEEGEMTEKINPQEENQGMRNVPENQAKLQNISAEVRERKEKLKTKGSLAVV